MSVVGKEVGVQVKEDNVSEGFEPVFWEAAENVEGELAVAAFGGGRSDGVAEILG